MVNGWHIHPLVGITSNYFTHEWSKISAPTYVIARNITCPSHSKYLHFPLIFCMLTTILGQIQLQIEYGSQQGQVQVNVMEVNSLFLPAGTDNVLSFHK